MTMRRPRHPLLQGAALVAGAALLVLAACETPRPTGLAPEREIPLASIRSEGDLAPAERVNLDRVRAAIAATAPADVRERRTGVANEFWFVVDADGKVVRSELVKGSDAKPLLSRSATETPARSESPLRTRDARPDRAEGVAANVTAGLAPEAIESVEVVKFAAGRVTPDAANVVWVQLRPGATLDAGAVSTVRAPLRREASPARTPEPLPRRHLDSVVVSRGAPGARVFVDGDSLPSGVRLRSAGADQPQPLIVVDGVPLEDASGTPAMDRLGSIDPRTIESVEILKGAAATRVYGERGANGVIRVRMKAGVER